MRIEDFEPSSLESMAHRITIGEQGELMTAINRFNQHYSEYMPESENREEVIGITPKLSLKRGTYDKVKKAYIRHCLRFNVRSQNLHSLCSKITDSRYMMNGFKQDLVSIQEKIWNMKNSGTYMIDNTEEMIEKLYVIKNVLEEKLELARNMIPSLNNSDLNIDSINIYVHNNTFADPNMTPYTETQVINTVDITNEDLAETLNTHNIKLRFEILFNHVNLKIHSNSDRGNRTESDIIGSAPIEHFSFILDMPLLPHLNEQWNNLDVDNGNLTRYLNRLPNRYSVKGINGDPYGRKHPFISSNYFNSEVYVCLGDFEGELAKYCHNYDIIGFLLTAITWASTYTINHTNPLNSIHSLWYGMPSNFDDNFYNVLGVGLGRISDNGTNCLLFHNNPNKDKFELSNYCNSCSLKDNCITLEKAIPDETYKQLLWDWAHRSNLTDFGDNEIEVIYDLSEDNRADWIFNILIHDLDKNWLIDDFNIYTENWNNPEFGKIVDKIYKEFLKMVPKIVYQMDSNISIHCNDKYDFLLSHFRRKIILEEDISVIEKNWKDTVDNFNYQRALALEEQVNEHLDTHENTTNQSTGNIHGGEAPDDLPIQGDREQDHITREMMERYMSELIGTNQVTEVPRRQRRE
jgi:hypothetical protein